MRAECRNAPCSLTSQADRASVQTFVRNHHCQLASSSCFSACLVLAHTVNHRGLKDDFRDFPPVIWSLCEASQPETQRKICSAHLQTSIVHIGSCPRPILTQLMSNPVYQCRSVGAETLIVKDGTAQFKVYFTSRMKLAYGTVVRCILRLHFAQMTPNVWRGPASFIMSGLRAQRPAQTSWQI